MNKQILRQEIVADLDRLLQAAKEPELIDTRGGIQKKKDSIGRIYYHNTNKGRRATTQEWQAVFKEDSSNTDKQERQLREVKGRLDRETKAVTRQDRIKDTMRLVDKMPEGNEEEKANKKQAQDALKKEMSKTGNVGLSQLLKDRANYSKEAVDVVLAKATDSLYADYAGVHDYLTNKEDRKKFNDAASQAIGGLVGKAQKSMTTFAQTVMDGIGSKIQAGLSSAKEGIDAIMKQPEMIILSGQMMGAMHAIQETASPATAFMNQQIANTAFSINIANAQVQAIAARVKNAKIGPEGQAMIQSFQDELKEVKTPEELEKLKERFAKEFEDFKNRIEGQRLADEARQKDKDAVEGKNISETIQKSGLSQTVQNRGDTNQKRGKKNTVTYNDPMNRTSKSSKANTNDTTRQA